MKSRLLAVTSLLVFSSSSYAFLFGYDNYEECTNDKEAEYIDKGSNPLEGMSRALAYCDKKFPILPPKYKKVSGITGKWAKYNSYYSRNNKNKYEISLDQPCAKISFIATMENGEGKTFSKVSTTGYSRNTVEFETPSPTAKVTIIETLININHDKRKGDK